jgi:hypothetical protein
MFYIVASLTSHPELTPSVTFSCDELCYFTSCYFTIITQCYVKEALFC